MKIIFNVVSGLGLNGGSLTVINSANTFLLLGHIVEIIDRSKNKCTWISLKTKHTIINNINNFPECDVVIATDYKSVKSTVEIPKSKCKLKFHYIRGWENWVMTDDEIINKILKSPLIKVVNGICLQNKLREYGIDSYIVRPGNDLENFNFKNIRTNDKIILGGLYHDKHRKTKRVDWILEIYRKLKEKYSNLELWMMGSCNLQLYGSKIITKYFKQPTIEEKNKFYNNIHIWLATSCLESLHIPPQEAMLTECAVVGTKAPLSGTQDYLINKETGLISENNLKDFIKRVEELIIDKKLREELGKAGREKIIELGDRKQNMKKFTEFMDSLL